MIISTEKQLALKISITSFFVLLFILVGIVFSSYIYGKDRAFNDFIKEQYAFEGMPIPRNIGSVPGLIITSGGAFYSEGMRNVGPKKGPRDIIIFDNQRNILKNDIVSLDSESIDQLFTIDTSSNSTISLDDQYFLIARKDINGNTFFLLHNITPFYEFHEQLLMLALVGSLLGLIVIFIMANHLAKVTIAPIREHSKELESYSHNVAHELRTPLSVMRSNLELLRLKPSEKLILSTDEEISNMERIIETLLFLAKLDEEKSPKEKVNMKNELNSLLKYYDDTIQCSFQKKAVTTFTHKELLKRVITNLIDNAIKYRSGGKVTITITEHSLTITNAIAKDFTEEEIEKLTKAFYQGDVSRNSSGYGLGLALVARIVELEGWKMEIQGKNKEFVVKILF